MILRPCRPSCHRPCNISVHSNTASTHLSASYLNINSSLFMLLKKPRTPLKETKEHDTDVHAPKPPPNPNHQPRPTSARSTRLLQHSISAESTGAAAAAADYRVKVTPGTLQNSKLTS